MKPISSVLLAAAAAGAAALITVLAPMPARAAVMAGYAANCSAGKTFADGNGINELCNRNSGEWVALPFAESGSIEWPAVAGLVPQGAYSLAMANGFIGARIAATAVNQPDDASGARTAQSSSGLARGYMGEQVLVQNGAGDLADGTPVPFTAYLDVRGLLSLLGPAVGDTRVLGTLSLELSLDDAWETRLLELELGTQDLVVDETLQMRGVALAGQPLWLGMAFTLSLWAEARSGSDDGSAGPPLSAVSFVADFMSQGARLYLAPDDPDLRFVAESGHDYARPAAVPEPPLLALLAVAAGAALLGTRYTGRRRRVSAAVSSATPSSSAIGGSGNSSPSSCSARSV